jgi:hypothetical protein
MKQKPRNEQVLGKETSAGVLKRRAFLKASGVATVTTALIIAGCDDDDNSKPMDEGVSLGTGNTAVLNYAYALEQLEAAFYTMVVANAAFATTFSAEEQAILTDIRDHEIVHREFLKAALAGDAIADLEVDFGSVNFSNKESVLGTAKVFEDLGVAAYNGAGKLLTDDGLLLVAGKIVSVEARHAATIRDLLNPGSKDFAGDDVISTSNGFDRAMTPSEVLMAADPFVVTKINASGLPTS